MLKLPPKWQTKWRWRNDEEKKKGWFAGCYRPERMVVLFWGWWLVGYYFLKLHEYMHAWQDELGELFGDCDSDECVMSKHKGIKVWWQIVRHRFSKGSWFCEECQKVYDKIPNDKK